MGRSLCCEKEHTNKGAWTREEDERLINYVKVHGEGSWRSLPKAAGSFFNYLGFNWKSLLLLHLIQIILWFPGLLRCGKSCRLRWINYLRPDLKRGNFTEEEDENSLLILVGSMVRKNKGVISEFEPMNTPLSLR